MPAASWKGFVQKGRAADQRIFLPVPSQADAFLQMVEREQMVLPLRIYDVEHNVALEVAQSFNTQLNFFFFVPLFNLRPDYFASFFRSYLRKFEGLGLRVKPEAQSWLPSIF